MVAGRSITFTGKKGAGKTTFLEKIKDSKLRMFTSIDHREESAQGSTVLMIYTVKDIKIQELGWELENAVLRHANKPNPLKMALIEMVSKYRKDPGTTISTVSDLLEAIENSVLVFFYDRDGGVDSAYAAFLAQGRRHPHFVVRNKADVEEGLEPLDPAELLKNLVERYANYKNVISRDNEHVSSLFSWNLEDGKELADIRRKVYSRKKKELGEYATEISNLVNRFLAGQISAQDFRKMSIELAEKAITDEEAKKLDAEVEASYTEYKRRQLALLQNYSYVLLKRLMELRGKGGKELENFMYLAKVTRYYISRHFVRFVFEKFSEYTGIPVRDSMSVDEILRTFKNYNYGVKSGNILEIIERIAIELPELARKKNKAAEFSRQYYAIVSDWILAKALEEFAQDLKNAGYTLELFGKRVSNLLRNGVKSYLASEKIGDLNFYPVQWIARLKYAPGDFAQGGFAYMFSIDYAKAVEQLIKPWEEVVPMKVRNFFYISAQKMDADSLADLLVDEFMKYLR